VGNGRWPGAQARTRLKMSEEREIGQYCGRQKTVTQKDHGWPEASQSAVKVRMNARMAWLNVSGMSYMLLA
jgi:hypothetical protein